MCNNILRQKQTCLPTTASLCHIGFNLGRFQVLAIIWGRQGWVSSGRNLFLPGHPEKSGSNLFLPVLSGQNWKKLDKTGKNYERDQKCWKKIIIILNYLQKIIMIMVTNAFGLLVLSKTMRQKINYYWPISSTFIRTKLEETGWQLGKL